MKLLGYSYSHEETNRLVSLLKFKGIPVHVTHAHFRSQPYKAAIFVCINRQLQDAKSLLLNDEHSVSNPVDVEEFEKNRVESGHDQILKWAIAILAVVVLVFALTVTIASRTRNTSANFAVQPTPLVTPVSDFRSGARA